MARRYESGAVERRGKTSSAGVLVKVGLAVAILGGGFALLGGEIPALWQRFTEQPTATVEDGLSVEIGPSVEIGTADSEPGPDDAGDPIVPPAEEVVAPEEADPQEAPGETVLAPTEPEAESEPVSPAESTSAQETPSESVEADAETTAVAASDDGAATDDEAAAAQGTAMSDEVSDLARARQLLAEGDAAQAYEVVRPLGAQGHPEALALLGYLRMHGQGVTEDQEAAFALLTRAAEAGSAAGQYFLANSYLHGTGTKADQVLALAWFMQSAARGHPGAIEERDKGLREVDEGIRVRAASKTTDLAIPLPPGWLTDLEKGLSVWGPSWFRNGTWHVAIEGQAVDGLVEGEASVALTASLSGYTSRTYEGRFTRGLGLDEALKDVEIGFLQSDEYRLPLDAASSGHADIEALWVQHEMDGLEIAACTKQAPNLFAVMRPAFTGIEDEAVKTAAIAVVKAYQAVCEVAGNTPGNVTLLPPDHAPVIDRGDTTYQPQLATMQLYGFDQPAEDWSINLKNFARRAHEEREQEAERQKKKEERQLKKARDEAAALARSMPDIRGLELGIGLPALRDALVAEAVAWSPPWKANREMPAYTSFEQKITLADQSTVTAVFASQQNDSRLILLVYEQNLRDGPDPETLRQKLYDKYGKPDDEAGQRTWFTWWLKGSLDGKAKGAFLKGRIQTDGKGRVNYLRLILNDYDLSLRDEAQGADARREAKRQAYEDSKSDDVKF